ncbi:MAG TPA: transcription elongation factor, partial [Vicinamibacteria bacterium]
MPEKKTTERARRLRRQGKSASTQAGEFVREEIHHVREGKHGARSTRQAIAIGLSKARGAGVGLPPPEGPRRTRRQAAQDLRRGRSGSRRKPSARRARASERALQREGRSAASHRALSRQARSAARRRRRR